MQDEFVLMNKYNSLKYRYLGNINTNLAAKNMYLQSKDKKKIQIGRNLYFIVMDDLKSYAILDTGD